MNAHSFPEESERRLVTVMFVDISGFTIMAEKMDPEELTRLMDKCFAIMESIILKYEGTIDKFIGDCVMVLYGVPKAIEDAAQNAVMTAIEIKHSLYKFNSENNLSIPLNVHVGINTGQVVAGTIGGIVKREYTVMGDAVNVASRLGGVSDNGQILVGCATYNAVKHLFRFKKLKPISLKGKAKPILIYALMSGDDEIISIKRMKDHGPVSKLVGRENEIALLDQHLKSLISGKGGIINLTGEAGIGKTRLIIELKNSFPVEDILFLEGSTHVIGRNLPYHVFISLLKTWSGINEHHTAEEAFRKLEKNIRKIYPAKANDIVPFIMRLMGYDISSLHEKIINEIEGDALEKLVHKSALELLKGVSELSPVVMILEDLHEADNSSIQLLSVCFSLASTKPILFINLFRPQVNEELHHIIEKAEQDYPGYFHEMRLQPLNTRQSALLMNGFLNIKKFPKTVQDNIIQRAGGNPFFIEEVLRSFVDTGVVEEKNGIFEISGEMNHIVIPESVNSVIMERIDKLDEDTRALLKVASVIGRGFFHKILQHVVDEPDSMEYCLNLLKKNQFILERRRMSEKEYFFRHELTRETVYNTILLQKRNELHEKIAEAIECTFDDRLNMFYGMLSYHYSCSANMDRAEKYMTMAGEEALKSGASSEALHYYREALRIYRDKCSNVSDPEKIAHMEKNIASSLYIKGQHADAMIHLQNALIYYGIKEYRHIVFLYAGLFFSIINLIIGLYLPFLKWKKNPTKRDIEFFNLFYTRVAIQSNLSPRRFVMDCFYLSRKLTQFDVMKIKGGFGMFAGLSLTLTWSGVLFRLSRKILSFTKKRMDHSDTRSLLVYKFAEIIQAYYSGHEYTVFDEQLVEEGLRIGEVDHVSGYLWYHGRILIEQGHYCKTRQFVSWLKNLGEEYSCGIATALKYYLNTRLLLKFRKLDDALIEVEEAIQYLRKMDFKQILITQYFSKARIHMLMNETQSAKKALKEGERIMSGLPVLPFYLSNYRLTCAHIDLNGLETAMQTEDQAEIKKNRKKTRATCRQMITSVKKSVYDQTEACRLMGRFYWLTGKHMTSFKWLNRSIAKGERLGARLETARTYLEVGEYLSSKENHPFKGRESWEPYLLKAEGEFKDLDLVWDLSIIDRIRRKNLQNARHDQPSDFGHPISV